MRAQCTLQFIHTDMLFSHVRCDDFAVMNQEGGLSLNKFAEAPVETREFSYCVVQ